MLGATTFAQVCCPAGRRWLAVVVAVVAACGTAGAVPSTALAGSASAAGWAKLAPAAHPSAREKAAMAYDAATSNIVLFGGTDFSDILRETWTWNGTTWAQASVTGPPALNAAAMAYDATTGNVVLFGGEGVSHLVGETWTWDGTSWTQQHPPVRPRPRDLAAMAYDAATGNVVLFGGQTTLGVITGDTWAWG